MLCPPAWFVLFSVPVFGWDGSAAGGSTAQEGSAPTPKLDAPLLESLKFGGRLRLRAEWRDPADYRIPGDPNLPPALRRAATDEATDNSDFVLMRTRVSLDARINQTLSAFVELQDARAFGEEASPVADTADIDLRQGFLEIRDVLLEKFVLRLGRMEVPALGDQRLISPLDWNNVSRSFDGALAIWNPDGWWLAGFAANLREARILPAGTPPLTGDADDDWILAGLYVSWRGVENHEFDVYAYVRDLSDDAFPKEQAPADLGPRQDGTYGARIRGKMSAFDYSVEAAYQVGRQAGDAIRAWGGAATLGATVDLGWKVRLGGEVAAATGDDGADGHVETFDPILPFAHFYHGHMDLVGWRNLRAGMVSLRVNPTDVWSVHVDAHWFELFAKEDFWYGAAATPIRRDPTGSAGKRLGAEVDVYVKGKLWDRMNLWFGYSRFFPGRYVDDTGFDPPGDWFFFQAEVIY